MPRGNSKNTTKSKAPVTPKVRPAKRRGDLLHIKAGIGKTISNIASSLDGVFDGLL
jgi:hypothetical protein